MSDPSLKILPRLGGVTRDLPGDRANAVPKPFRHVVKKVLRVASGACLAVGVLYNPAYIVLAILFAMFGFLKLKSQPVGTGLPGTVGSGLFPMEEPPNEYERQMRLRY